MVPFHLKPPTSGDAHGVQHVTREAPVLARPNETTGLQVAAGRSRSEEKANKTAFAAFFFLFCQLVFRLTLLMQSLHDQEPAALRAVQVEQQD